MPLILVITDGDTPPVHCQRHIYVYHFVYLRPTQAAHEYSIGVAFGGGGAAESFVIDTVSGEVQSRLILHSSTRTTSLQNHSLSTQKLSSVLIVINADTMTVSFTMKKHLFALMLVSPVTLVILNVTHC